MSAQKTGHIGLQIEAREEKRANQQANGDQHQRRSQKEENQHRGKKGANQERKIQVAVRKKRFAIKREGEDWKLNNKPQHKMDQTHIHEASN